VTYLPLGDGPLPSEINPKDAAAVALGKTPLQLIPPVGENLVAQVLASGAAKYGPWNWRAIDIRESVYIGAIKRHANAMNSGEWFDRESGLPHAAHIAATAMILIDALEHGKLVFDTGANREEIQGNPITATQATPSSVPGVHSDR